MIVTARARTNAPPTHFSGRSPWLPVLEGISVTSFALLLAPLAARISESLESWADAAVALIGVPIAIFIADFASGVVHWLCDTFFNEDSPIIGRFLIHPFREHHRDPLAMTRHGFLELTGNSCMALIPALATILWLKPGLFADVLAAGIAVTMTCANLFHQWAHASHVPAAAGWLQKHGLILPPEHHARHHSLNHDQAFCVTTGWANHFADRLLLFRRLERMMGVLAIPTWRAGGRLRRI